MITKKSKFVIIFKDFNFSFLTSMFFRLILMIINMARLNSFTNEPKNSTEGIQTILETDKKQFAKRVLVLSIRW